MFIHNPFHHGFPPLHARSMPGPWGGDQMGGAGPGKVRGEGAPAVYSGPRTHTHRGIWTIEASFLLDDGLQKAVTEKGPSKLASSLGKPRAWL